MVNLTKMTSNMDKNLVERERLKNAITVVMTLIYKDKFSQL